MKRFILSLLLVLSLAMGFSQEVKLSGGAKSYATEQEAIGKGTPSTEWVMIKTVKHIVYTGARGGRYYVVKGKNNAYYVRYLPKKKE